jgi:membrane associated rhomboid family serine protease
MQANLAFHDFQVWRLLTGTFFFNSEPWEIVWLLVFLALFGLELEKKYPSTEMGWFYCLSGVGSCLIWGISAVAWEDKLPLGTSGAITAVIMLALMNHPSRRIRAGKYLIVPAWALGILYYGVVLRYYAWDSWTLTLPAHIGGALCALLYRQFDLRWKRLLGPEANIDASQATEMPTSRVEPMEELVEFADQEDDKHELSQFDSQVDQVLAKISRAGSESLTDQERQLLQNASERYRQRRH